MATRNAITLGELTDRAERHVRSGRFETVEEVVEEALAALDRQEEAWNAMVRAKIEEALADPRPALPIDEAFAEVDRRIDARRGR